MQRGPLVLQVLEVPQGVLVPESRVPQVAMVDGVQLVRRDEMALAFDCAHLLSGERTTKVTTYSLRDLKQGRKVCG